MRFLIYILLLVLISFLGHSQKNNLDSVQNVNISSITIKLDTIYNSIKSNIDSRNNKTTIEIKDADKFLEELKDDGYKEYSPGIIALITIAISSFVAYKISINQNTKHEEVTRRQIDAQMAIAQDGLVQSTQQIEAQIRIAQDQLNQNRDQMLESSRITLLQVRNNNISAARIDWIQKLRPLMAELISKTSDFHQAFSQLDKLITKKTIKEEDKIEAVKLQDRLLKNADKCDIIWNQILLFLNPNEKVHQELIQSFEQLSRNIADKVDHRPFEREITEDELIDKARAVLKTAWEQAKNIN